MLLLEADRERLMLSQACGHFKRSPRTATPSGPAPEGAHGLTLDRAVLARQREHRGLRRARAAGLGERTVGARATAQAQPHELCARAAAHHALGAPAPAACERTLERARAIVVGRAPLRLLARGEHAQRERACIEPHRREWRALEAPREQRGMCGVVGEPLARPAAERGALATIERAARPGLAGPTQQQATPPARRETASRERAGRERRRDAAARQRVVAIAQRAARAAAAEAHALRAPHARAAITRGAHRELELVVGQ